MTEIEAHHVNDCIAGFTTEGHAFSTVDGDDPLCTAITTLMEVVTRGTASVPGDHWIVKDPDVPRWEVAADLETLQENPEHLIGLEHTYRTALLSFYVISRDNPDYVDFRSKIQNPEQVYAEMEGGDEKRGFNM